MITAAGNVRIVGLLVEAELDTGDFDAAAPALPAQSDQAFLLSDGAIHRAGPRSTAGTPR